MQRHSRWNHNIHYHPVILGALTPSCGRVLDVGCGEGMLAAELSRRADHVTALDLDAAAVASARAQSAAENVEYRVADVFTRDLPPASFDAVVSVAVLHHLGTARGLERMRELLRPGGTLAVVGLARPAYPRDLPWDVAGAVFSRLLRMARPYWDSAAPQLWPPPETFRETRRIAAGVLPGSRFRRHVLWRYSLVWRKPGAPGPAAPLPSDRPTDASAGS
jgi:SAM-dependent methyltransferase